MVIVLKNDVSENEKKNIKTLLKSKNFKINEVKGDESTILAAVGRLAMDIREVEVLPGVAKVVPISKPYKSRSDYKNWRKQACFYCWSMRCRKPGADA